MVRFAAASLPELGAEGQNSHVKMRFSFDRRNRRFDCMRRTRSGAAKPVPADAIASLAEKGQDVSRFFKGQGRMVQPVQRVNVDISAGMLAELDRAALELNVSRQAVIKTLIRQGLDHHYLATRSRT